MSICWTRRRSKVRIRREPSRRWLVISDAIRAAAKEMSMQQERGVEGPKDQASGVGKRETEGAPGKEREAAQPYATEVEDYTHPRAPRTPRDPPAKDEGSRKK
jgi:hypothetical protein